MRFSIDLHHSLLPVLPGLALPCAGHPRGRPGQAGRDRGRRCNLMRKCASLPTAPFATRDFLKGMPSGAADTLMVSTTLSLLASGAPSIRGNSTRLGLIGINGQIN